MPADPIQASSPTTAAEQVFPTAQPKGKPAPTEASAPARSQPNTDYAELSQTHKPPAQAVKQPLSSPNVIAYHIDEQTKQLYFQVLNPQSGQVISQVPPQDVLDDQAQIAQYLQARSAPSDAPAEKGKGD